MSKRISNTTRVVLGLAKRLSAPHSTPYPAFLAKYSDRAHMHTTACSTYPRHNSKKEHVAYDIEDDDNVAESPQDTKEELNVARESRTTNNSKPSLENLLNMNKALPKLSLEELEHKIKHAASPSSSHMIHKGESHMETEHTALSSNNSHEMEYMEKIGSSEHSSDLPSVATTDSSTALGVESDIDGSRSSGAPAYSSRQFARDINRILHSRPVVNDSPISRSTKYKLSENYVKTIKGIVHAVVESHKTELEMDDKHTPPVDSTTKKSVKGSEDMNIDDIETARDLFTGFKNEIREYEEVFLTSEFNDEEVPLLSGPNTDSNTQEAKESSLISKSNGELVTPEAYISNMLASFKDRVPSNIEKAFNMITLTDAMHVCAKRGAVVQAQTIFNMLPKLDIKPDDVAYNTLMLAYTKANDISGAKKVFKTMKESGISPDSASYGTMITYFIKHDDKYAAWALYDEMRENNVFRSPVIMHSMMHLCIKMKEYDRAQTLFDHIKNNMYDPNDALYSCRLLLCAKRKEAEMALNIMDEMAARGIEPNIDGYLALMSSLGSRKDYYLDAFNIYEQMKEAGIPDSFRQIFTLMKISSFAGDVQRFELLWNEFIEMRQKLGTQSYPGVYQAMKHAYACYSNYFLGLRKEAHLNQRFGVYDDNTQTKVNQETNCTKDITSENEILKNNDLINKDVVDQITLKNAQSPSELAATKWLVLDEIKPSVVERLANEKMVWSDNFFSEDKSRTIPKKQADLNRVKFQYLLSLCGIPENMDKSYTAKGKFEAAVNFYLDVIKPDTAETFKGLSNLDFLRFVKVASLPESQWPTSNSNSSDGQNQNALMKVYKEFEQWDDLREALAAKTVDDRISSDVSGGITKSQLIEEIRDKEFRGIKGSRTFFSVIIRELARHGELEKVSVFLEKMRNFRYLGYLSRFKLNEMPILVQAIRQATQEGYVAEAKAILKYLDSTTEETPEERYRRMLRTRTHAPGWWGWDVIAGPKVGKKSQSKANARVHQNPNSPIDEELQSKFERKKEPHHHHSKSKFKSNSKPKSKSSELDSPRGKANNKSNSKVTSKSRKPTSSFLNEMRKDISGM